MYVLQEAHSAHPDTAFGLDAFHDYKNSLIRDLSPPHAAGGVETPSSRATVKKRPKSGDWDSEGEGYKRESGADAPSWEVPDIQVKHFPNLVCCFTKSVFVLPSRGSVAEAPLSDHRDIHAVGQGIPGVDVSSQAGGEQHIPAGATLLAHCLQHVTAQVWSFTRKLNFLIFHSLQNVHSDFYCIVLHSPLAFLPISCPDATGWQ